MTKNFVSDTLRAPLGKKPPLAVQAVLFLLATAVFYAFAVSARYAVLDEFSDYRIAELTRITAIVYTAIFAIAYGVQLRVGRRLSLDVQILLGVITGAVILAKISLLDYVSDDYTIFLSDWIYSYSQLGIKEGLGTYIGSDYTPPYLYLMLLVSRFKNFPWQYLVKAISILTDVLLGYAVMKLCSLRVKGDGARLLVFHIAGILPTVVFNGAYWGQCDAIYTSFCLLALYMGLTKRPVRSMIFFGVALSFKLQTVFFLPVLLPLWLRRDIGLRHVLLIPAAYMAMMIPALWGGKSLHHVLTVYAQQAGTYNFITVNAPNLYQFLPQEMDRATLYTMFGPMAMTLGFAFLAGVCALLCARRDSITEDGVLLACVLMLAGVPYFLPKMHERYTFGADVLSLVLAIYKPRRIALPLLFGFASYLAYTAGLPGDAVMDLKWAAMFQLAGILLTAAELWRSLNGRSAANVAEVKA
ncbi:MAG: glycosyltransferase 87 family protein [Clostridia bacterium]|nr:glycosyltransferase 87 family protein [Clostridia bacterium]